MSHLLRRGEPTGLFSRGQAVGNAAKPTSVGFNTWRWVQLRRGVTMNYIMVILSVITMLWSQNYIMRLHIIPQVIIIPWMGGTMLHHEWFAISKRQAYGEASTMMVEMMQISTGVSSIPCIVVHAVGLVTWRRIASTKCWSLLICHCKETLMLWGSAYWSSSGNTKHCVRIHQYTGFYHITFGSWHIPNQGVRTHRQNDNIPSRHDATAPNSA